MRIALIDPSLFTLPYDEALALALSDAGHKVSLYGRPLRRDEPRPAPRIAHVPQFYATTAALDGAWEPVRLAAKAADHVASCAGFLRAIAAARPDIVHYQWAPFPAVDRLVLGRLRGLAPLVLTVHDTRPYNDRPSSPLQKLGMRALYDQFDRLIVHTRAGVDRLVAEGVEPHRLACIPHGPLHAGRTKGRPPLARAVGDRPVTVALIGKLKPYKGADILIRAASLLPEATRAKATFLIAGKPYMETEPLLEQARLLGVRERFDFDLRFLSESELQRTFAHADIFVFPYREIEASGVLFAALAEGKPIVASRLGAFAELLEDGVHGHLTPPEDPAALARALAPLIEDAGLRRRMGDAVATLSQAIPSWAEIADRTTALYRDCLRARPVAQGARTLSPAA